MTPDSSPFSLEGKTVLITGASSGIGRACAVEISKSDASRCFLTGRNRKELESTKQSLHPGCESEIIICDLLKQEQIDELCNHLPLLDGVVVNAGINRQKTLRFISDKDTEEIFKTNFFSTIWLIRGLMKRKLLSKEASIVFIGSVSASQNVSIGNAVYGASKSALNAFMRYAALELSGKGIRCNAIHPGRIETPLLQTGIMSDEEIKKDIKKYPLKRYGRPEEIAYGVIYLLSDASKWITGSELTIDGGRSLT